MFAPSIPNTRRVIVVALLVMAFLVGALLAAGPSEGSRVASTHEVRAGETFWSIASRVRRRSAADIEAIIHRNSLVDATIEPGEVLVLP